MNFDKLLAFHRREFALFMRSLGTDSMVISYHNDLLSSQICR